MLRENLSFWSLPLGRRPAVATTPDSTAAATDREVLSAGAVFCAVVAAKKYGWASTENNARMHRRK
jgi:hypothetical protein